MSTVRQVIMEAETVSAREFIRAVMGEEGLRAAARAAARQADARRGAMRQEPLGRQEPAHQQPARQEPIGAPITNNSPGRPEVRVVGRSRPAKPIRSAKSAIVPEPDQIQSAPPTRPTLPHRT